MGTRHGAEKSSVALLLVSLQLTWFFLVLLLAAIFINVNIGLVPSA